jgi:hypothetical protein
MTKRKPPNPDGLNDHGNGKGLKVVSRPAARKRGQNATDEAKQQRIAEQRAKHKGKNLSNMPAAEIAQLGDEALDKPLTDKAKAFIRFWAQGESITSASARAGYGDGATYAYKLAHHPAALALYNEEKRLYEAASQMTRKRVNDGFLEGIEMARMVNEPASFINGWKNIGQMCGYFEPRKAREINLNVKGEITHRQMSAMSDAELLKTIQEGAATGLRHLETETAGDEDDEAGN